MKLLSVLAVVLFGSIPALAQSKAKGPLPAIMPLNDKGLPKYSEPLKAGSNELNLKNPSHFKVVVQIRCGSTALQFDMDGKQVKKLSLPDGEYTIFFRFKTDNRAQEGRSFTAKNKSVVFDDDKTKKPTTDAELGDKILAKK